MPADARAPGRRGRGTPAVVFVDHAKWDCFFQLSARLRRAGVRTVRVSTAAGLHHRLVARPVFDRVEQVAGIDGLARLGELLAGEEVIDVQATEMVLPATAAALAASAPPAVAQVLARRLQLSDKLAARLLMASCGAAVPDVVPLTAGVAVEEIVDLLGLPVVVKARLGASGAGVAVAATTGELGELLGGPARGPRYAERFVPGQALSYGAIVGRQRVEQELLTRAWHRRPPALGPWSEHETLEEPVTAAACRRVALAARCAGPLQIDVVLDGDGVPWLIDLNARAWGDLGAALATGVDLTQGYLLALAARDAPPALRAPPPGVRYSCFPTDLAEELSSGHPLAAVGCLARAARPCARWYGTGYLLAEVASSGLLAHHLMREALRARGGRRPSGRRRRRA